jgi:hypothetical protein
MRSQPLDRKKHQMTVTALDPKIAPIVIDLQKGLVSLPTIHSIEGGDARQYNGRGLSRARFARGEDRAPNIP